MNFFFATLCIMAAIQMAYGLTAQQQKAKFEAKEQTRGAWIQRTRASTSQTNSLLIFLKYYLMNIINNRTLAFQL